ncbi:hypothetical protein GCK72_022376 [Caenorhabditis remanei]|uniref:F-box domain-containing protein n=1 Tax=Caenorhabditis remanei TaxID=31234 RepID=A0A6A5FTK2_CAERE|nr:hypothetical protein GCK72_022376 [Caenorhabditis remanei]KAF1745928.1 hypothetical protein GCK72_022376 [Caenorhabditis remanei]
MSSDFPLFRLPEKALKLVIQCMEYIEIVGFSLVSNKTKEIVRSINLKIEQISLTVDDVISIRFDPDEDGPSTMVWSFWPKDNNNTVPIPVYMPARVTAMRDVDTQQNFVEYQNPGLSIEKWVEHVQYIFYSSEIDYLAFADETCKFDWISLKDALRKFKILILFFQDFCSLECAQLAMRHFPSVRSVTSFSPSFNDPSQYRHILIQNLDILSLGYEDMSLKIGLDDLLMMNSKTISIKSPTLTGKMVNQFFKHWIKGSNPRMEFAHFEFVNNQLLNKETLLKGLYYEDVRLNSPMRENVEVDGYDIVRNGGTAGTISIEQTDQGRNVYFQIFE